MHATALMTPRGSVLSFRQKHYLSCFHLTKFNIFLYAPVMSQLILQTEDRKNDKQSYSLLLFFDHF